VLVSSIRIVDGSVQYQRLAGREPSIRLEKINLVVGQGGPGEVLRIQGDATAEPGAVRLSTRDATLTPGGARAVGDMALQANVDIESSDVAPIGSALLGSPVMSGAMKGRIELRGTPARASAIGLVSLEPMTLSGERPTCAAARQD